MLSIPIRLMVDIAIQIIKDTTEHFSVVTGASGKFSDEQILAAFGDKLHDGVPLDPNAPPV